MNLSLTRLRVLALAALAALATTIAFVSTGDAADVTVAVGAGGDKRISVPKVKIQQGDKVTFRWQDNGHDLSLGGPGGESLVIGEEDEGFQVSRILDRPGTYALVCQEHDEDGMNATLTVEPAPDGPDPSTLPPPAKDIVLGGESSSPANVSIVKGASVYFHFQSAGSVTFSDGVSSGQVASRTSYRRAFEQVGTYGYTAGSRRGTITVTEPQPLGVAEVPVGTPAAATVQVGSGNSYSPSAVTINEGDVVQWNWAGGPHNIQFQDGTGAPFKSSGSWSAKFYVPSATPLQFVCTAHPGMSGTVTVTDTGAAGPNEQPPAGTPAEEEPPAEEGPGLPGDATIGAEVAVGSPTDTFTESDVSVQTGQWVRWTWTSGVHNVKFADGVGNEPKASGTWSRRFLTAGDYSYACDLHPAMTGVVRVTGEPVADDGNSTAGDGTSGGGDGEATTSTKATTTPKGTSARPAAGGGTATPVATPAAVDTSKPAFTAVRTRLLRGKRRHTIRLQVTKDSMFQVTMKALGRSRDLVRTRRFKLYARKGTSTLRLPAMNLTARRYRLTLVAIDQAGNRSAPRRMTVKPVR